MTLSGKADTAGVNERSNTPSRCAGVVATACTQGKRTQHGRPQGVVRDDQPDAREGQAGRPGESSPHFELSGLRVQALLKELEHLGHPLAEFVHRPVYLRGVKYSAEAHLL